MLLLLLYNHPADWRQCDWKERKTLPTDTALQAFTFSKESRNTPKLNFAIICMSLQPKETVSWLYLLQHGFFSLLN